MENLKFSGIGKSYIAGIGVFSGECGGVEVRTQNVVTTILPHPKNCILSGENDHIPRYKPRIFHVNTGANATN